MFAIIFLNADSVEHIYINMTRIYMTLMMIAAMALLMLLMITMMYPDKKKNIVITVSSFIVLLLAFAGVHIKVGVADIQYMIGMISHQSIAIMTSQNAHITDPRVRKLADGIIAAQKKEIAKMKALINSLQQNH
ncbi:DUF305 domain-containing protein [Mucilaginibacter pallidiroseus]|nr:DUF305 domain-containing protein [Mucilaginibacter pallidiroseus]